MPKFDVTIKGPVFDAKLRYKELIHLTERAPGIMFEVFAGRMRKIDERITKNWRRRLRNSYPNMARRNFPNVFQGASTDVKRKPRRNPLNSLFVSIYTGLSYYDGLVRGGMRRGVQIIPVNDKAKAWFRKERAGGGFRREFYINRAVQRFGLKAVNLPGNVTALLNPTESKVSDQLNAYFIFVRRTRMKAKKKVGLPSVWNRSQGLINRNLNQGLNVAVKRMMRKGL